MAVAALSVLIGTSHPVEPVLDLPDLMGKVGLSDISHSSAKFDPAELSGLNARTLLLLPYANVAERLAALGVGGGEDFWLAVRGNLQRLEEAKDWWQVVATDQAYGAEDADLIAAARAALPPEPWTTDTWSALDQGGCRFVGQEGASVVPPAAAGVDRA